MNCEKLMKLIDNLLEMRENKESIMISRFLKGSLMLLIAKKNFRGGEDLALTS